MKNNLKNLIFRLLESNAKPFWVRDNYIVYQYGPSIRVSQGSPIESPDGACHYTLEISNSIVKNYSGTDIILPISEAEYHEAMVLLNKKQEEATNDIEEYILSLLQDNEDPTDALLNEE